MDYFFRKKPAATEDDLSRQNLTDDDVRELLIQCYLVEHGGRHGYLFQTVNIEDYKNKSFSVLERFIKEKFPALHTFRDRQGLYVARNALRAADVDTNAKAGKVLGYACADGFDRLDHFKTTYDYAVVVRLKNKKEVFLYSFVCESAKHKARFEKDVERIRMLLVGSKDLPLFRGKPISVLSVESRVEAYHPTSYFLDMLLRRGKPVPLDELSNVLFNLFDSNSSHRILSAYNPKNATHRGIMAALLCLYIHNPLEPFYPLQFTGKQEVVGARLEQLSKLIVKTLRSAK